MKMKRFLAFAVLASISVMGIQTQAAVVADQDTNSTLSEHEKAKLYYSPHPSDYRTEYSGNSAMVEAFEKLRTTADAKQRQLAHLMATDSKRKRDLAKKPDVTIGMTASQVLTHSNWGVPNYTRTANGAERWVYINGEYLFLKNGRVTMIEN
jgi:hypothetical protein